MTKYWQVAIFAAVVIVRPIIGFGQSDADFIKFGSSQQPLIGARPAAPGEFPWMASLNTKNGHFCGGSLIHPRWILTAAHCLIGKKAGDIEVRIGSTDRTAKPPNILIRTIASNGVFVHPEYDDEKPESTPDVGLLRLSAPIDEITSVCLYSHLPRQGDLPSLKGWAAVVMGWGRMVPLGCAKPPANLQKLYIDIVPDAFCRGDIDAHLCAGRRSYESAWACHGDSGSPMLAFLPDWMFDWSHATGFLEKWMRARPPVQVGIASTLAWTEGVCDCRAPYATYTSLADPDVADWIQQTATGLSPCTCRQNACLDYPSEASSACLNSPSECQWTGSNVNPDTLTCQADLEPDGTVCPVEQVTMLDRDLPWRPDSVAGTVCVRGRCVDRCGFWGPRQSCSLAGEVPRAECRRSPVAIDLQAEEERRRCERSFDVTRDCDEIDPYRYEEECEYVTFAMCHQDREFHEWHVPGLDRTGCLRSDGDTIGRPCSCPPSVRSAYGGRVLEPGGGDDDEFSYVRTLDRVPR